MKRAIGRFVKTSQQQRLLHNWGTSLLLTPLVFIGNAFKLARRMPLPVPAPVSYWRALENERTKGSN